MKACTKCKQVKRFRQFNGNRATTDGMSKWCKDCCREYNKKWYARKKKERERAK